MAALLYRLGSFAARRAWQVIVAWVLILGLSIGAFLAFGGSLSNSFDIPGTASGAVVDELTQELPDSAGMTASVVYQTTDGSPFTDEQKQAISDVAAGAEDLDDIASVIDPFDAQQQQDGRRAAARRRADADRRRAGPARRRAGAARRRQGAARRGAGAADGGAHARPRPPAPGPSSSPRSTSSRRSSTRRSRRWRSSRTTLDASRAELDDQAEQVELGSTLVELSDGIGVVSEDGSTAIVNVTFNETRLELPEGAKETTIEHFESEPIDGVAVYFGSELAQGVPELFGIGEAIGLVFAAIVLIVTLGLAPRRGTADRHGARRHRRRRDRLAVVLGHRRHGVDHPGAGRHARPRGGHRLLAVHRLPPPQAAAPRRAGATSRSGSRRARRARPSSSPDRR